MKDRIPLSPEQVSKIKALFAEMKAKAIAVGARLINFEEQLENKFRNGTITAIELRTLLKQLAEVRAELRFVHLSTHLKTPAIVSAEQIARYNILRGYAKDPCSHVPEGHDAKLWRLHNGCK